LANLPPKCLLSLILLKVSWSQSISGSTEPIFTIFSPNGSYLFVDDRSGFLFPIRKETLPYQSISCKNWLTNLYSARWRSEMDKNIAVLVLKYSVTISELHFVQV